MQPLVSCLMPTYNRAWKNPHMLGEAVYWFLAQDYRYPMELVVLVDTPPDAGLSFDVTHTGNKVVRVVHVHTRYPSLAAKFDALVSLARGDILLPWEDDDISLPNRVSHTVTQMCRLNVDYWNPKGAFYQVGQEPLALCSPHSVHHNASGFTPAGYQKTGGYGMGGDYWANRQDAWMDQALRRAARTHDAYVGPEEMTYVYRWCSFPGSPNLSGHGDPNAGWAAESAPSVNVLVAARPRRNYQLEADDYRAKVRGAPVAPAAD